MYLIDEAGDKWSLIGRPNLDIAEQAILQGKRLTLHFKMNGKYRNVNAVEIAE